MSRGGSARTGLLSPDESRAASAEMTRLRREMGLSQADLAGRLGRSPWWVSKRETGASRFTRGEVWRVRAALGVEAPPVPRPGQHPSNVREAVLVRSFRDIPRTCPCRWEMTFAARRVSGWRLVWAARECLHHGNRRGIR